LLFESEVLLDYRGMLLERDITNHYRGDCTAILLWALRQV